MIFGVRGAGGGALLHGALLHGIVGMLELWACQVSPIHGLCNDAWGKGKNGARGERV